MILQYDEPLSHFAFKFLLRRYSLVSAFLSHFFKEYVDYGFTAALEDRLDDVACGRVQWKGVLRDFWGPFRGGVAGGVLTTSTQPTLNLLLLRLLLFVSV